MIDKSDINSGPTTGFDPAIQSEKLGFEAEEMLACGSCGRLNPPNRISCLYCSGALAIDATALDEIKSSFRKPETWERGFSLVFQPGSIETSVDIDRAGKVVSLSNDELSEILRSGLPLPIARVGTDSEADSVAQILGKLGIPTRTVSDNTLAPEKPPRRLRSIEFGDSMSFTLFNTGEKVSHACSEVCLAVEGVISESRIDQTEKRRLRGDKQVVDGSSSAKIEPVLDLYTRDDNCGYRVMPIGFDFSFLGDEKGMLLADNFRRLVERVSSSSPGVKYVSEYNHHRQILGRVWEIETLQEKTGLRPTGIGQKAFGTVSSTTNLKQFTMFSRLQRHLL